MNNLSLVTKGLVAVAVIFPVLASTSVGLRLYARRLKSQRLRADDWTIVLSLFICWVISINTLVGAGLGGIDVIKVSPITAAIVYERMLWISGFPLAIALAMIKISILLFYTRIFITKPFRRCAYIMIVVLVGWLISTIFTQLFAYSPVSAAWNPLAPPSDLKINYGSFALAVAGMSIGFDVVILCFPLPVIRSLHMATKRKILVAGILWLGIFCCVAAAVRFYYTYLEIRPISGHPDGTYVLISHGYLWSHVEPNCSIIAACLPTYGPLFADGGMASFFRSIRSLFSLGSAASSNDKLPSDDSKNLLSGGQINGNHEMTTPKKAWQRLDGSNVGVYAGDHRGNGGYIGKIGQSDLEAQLVAPNKITVTQVFGSEYERAQDA